LKNDTVFDLLSGNGLHPGDPETVGNYCKLIGLWNVTAGGHLTEGIYKGNIFYLDG
jgi:hypothetical protein